MAKDPYRYFRIEARELLEQLAKAALDLEKGAAEAEQVSRLLRLAHTLKGAARVVKQREISDLAHQVEDLLAPHREGGAVSRTCIDGVLAALDAIAAGLAKLPIPEGEAPAVAAEAARTVRADVTDIDELLEGLSEVYGGVAAIRRAVGGAGRARHLATMLAENLSSPLFFDAAHARHGAAPLLKARSTARELTAVMSGFEHGIGGILERVDRELRQAWDLSERLRLIPAASVFHTLERVARDAAHGADKRVKFEASGGDVRLDAHVLDGVQSALVQIVRNAVAHGIEPPLERTREGKPVEGRVTLEVTRRGHRVSFACRDDGRGVDIDGVRQAIERKGGRTIGTDGLGPAELAQWVLRGGITTSAAVTELAGRGIGLDVVREAAERLGGEVTLTTEAGSGTAIELRVPVSLASLEALIVEAGDDVVAIPLDAVRATTRAAPSDVTRASEGDAIEHNGTLVPIVRLASWLAGPEGEASAAAGAKPFSAVLVAADGAVAALAVDRLRGVETVMLRPLPTLAPADAIVAGIHIDAESNPRLVLDPGALVKLEHGPARATGAASERRPILVIDDSLTTRMLEQSILESAGYEVWLAVSAEEALELARRRDYGLFLVDVEMPGMDGFEFIERSRADPSLRDVPCILVTSRGTIEDRRRGEAVGASDYIVKSEFDQVRFLDRVAELLRQ